MSLFNVTVKKGVIDHRTIERAVDREKRYAISGAAFQVMKTQKRSIRRRKSASQPGQPPHAHSTSPVATPKRIRYAYDGATETAIVGMERVGLSTVTGSTPLPEALEKGGQVTVKPRGRRRRYRARIRKRPSALPALVQNVNDGTVLEVWRGVVRP